jgi:hypothetical protein
MFVCVQDMLDWKSNRKHIGHFFKWCFKLFNKYTKLEIKALASPLCPHQTSLGSRPVLADVHVRMSELEVSLYVPSYTYINDIPYYSDKYNVL